LSELLRQLKGRRYGHFAHFALLRLLDGHRHIDAIPRLDMRAEGARHLFLNGMEHGRYEYIRQAGTGLLIAVSTLGLVARERGQLCIQVR
jgi:hypothetical protein